MIVGRLSLGRGRHSGSKARLARLSDTDLLDTLEFYGNSIRRMGEVLGVDPFRTLRVEFTRRGLRIPKPDQFRRALVGITTGELQRVLDLNHGNISPLAEMYGVHRVTMRDELNRRGIRTKGGTRRLPQTPDGLLQLRHEGRSLWQIAEVFGVSATAIRYRLRKAGVPPMPFPDRRGKKGRGVA